MKREIKFRAWDGTKYITFDNHQYDLIYNDISGWNIYPNLPNYKGEWTTGESSGSAKSFKLEQFTGLKDKNGVECFEGDIVKMYRHDDISHKHEVSKVWKSGKYHDEITEVKFIHSSFVVWSELIQSHRAFMYMARPGESFEIIGNIHKHKHLLK